MTSTKWSSRTKVWIGLGSLIVAAVVIALLVVFLTPTPVEDERPSIDYDEFPSDFMFGCSSSAYQTEGAWDVDGKGENNWDRLIHSNPAIIFNQSNADVAANSYEFYTEDVRALKQVGAHFYRFSINWARVFPTGDTAHPNELGLQYYDQLIDELLANGIQPMVTMYHSDLPQSLQELGGWTDPKIVDYFEAYATLLYDRFASRVKHWITINEPSGFCAAGYSGEHAPRESSPGVGTYLCVHNVLLAHGRAYRVYREQYQAQFGGKVGIAVDGWFALPKDASKGSDVLAADRRNQFGVGLAAHPIYSRNGDYHQVVRSTVLANSRQENRSQSRLPEFTTEELELLKGSADFFGLNYFTSSYAEEGTEASAPSPSYTRDRNVIDSYDTEWPAAGSAWLRSNPNGLRAVLNWVKNEYDNPEVIITENGWSDHGDPNDVQRVEYLQGHLHAVLTAIKDGCRVIGYSHWALIDNFEWLRGYSERFGLFHIDFESPQRTRTAKRSVAAYSDVIQTRRVSNVLPEWPSASQLAFPSDFVFGCASSSYQIEGGWDADGKGENIWDRLVHTEPEFIVDRSTGDTAANSYELYADDVQALRQMNVNFYRFSISWARIMADGDVASLNEVGLQYYDHLIDELLRNGIVPMVTMYHWDLPQRLEELGGWASRTIVDYFEQYAKVLLDRYADRVKYWITFNEAGNFCMLGYSGELAPNRWSPGHGTYLCFHHVLLAHARTYHLFDRSYRGRNNGTMGMAMNFAYAWPLNASNPVDIEAAERYKQFSVGIFAHPVFTETGDYPELVRRIVDENSEADNFGKSRLPEFTEQEVDSLKGSADFFGLNYYTAVYAEEGAASEVTFPSYVADRNVLTSANSSWPAAKSYWLRSVPEGLKELLVWVKDHYSNPQIFITENGWSDEGELIDVGRVDYLRAHLNAVLEANALGAQAIGYAHWSVIDNFEWALGYTEHFGMYHVDFESDRKTRTPKLSSVVYRHIIDTRIISSEMPDEMSNV